MGTKTLGAAETSEHESGLASGKRKLIQQGERSTDFGSHA